MIDLLAKYKFNCQLYLKKKITKAKMNEGTAKVNAAHKSYLKCVDKEMGEYLKSPTLRADGSIKEFCAPEKATYMNTMKAVFPHQYENLVRVDANTY